MPDNALPITLGRYRIQRRLGTGGMAEVFLAKSTGAEGIEKTLVLKRILPTFARSANFISMFVDEAKVAMRLNHPNIVQVYAFEQVDQEFLLAMEFVDGLDLGRLLASCKRSSERLPYGLAAYIIMEVARGLDYAHRRRDERGDPMEIVHRDVSPQNILLAYDGVAKVTDFGIAKARLVTEEKGVIKGKFSYMSPEQAIGERVDRRSDVYSLGILLAELLMGRPMYPGIQGLDVVERVRVGRVTLPSAVDPQVPAALERVVARATAFDRKERYETAREFASGLSQYLHQAAQLYDDEALERFISRVAPRVGSTPPDEAEVPTARAQTVRSAPSAEREIRERRRVTVVSGLVRGTSDAPFDMPSAAVDEQAAEVLANLAFKSDAVLSWPDGVGRGRFRFIIGLGKATVHDPLKAVRLAQDTLDVLQGLADDSQEPVNASIGLSQGAVSTVRDPSGVLRRYAPAGAVLDVAERLASVARPGEILAAGEAYRLVRRDFAFDEEREVSLSSSSNDAPRSFGAWRLRGMHTHEERVDAVRVVESIGGLMGRSSELEDLRAMYRECVRFGRTVCAAIVGELGVGKSALIEAALGSLEPPPRILRTECTFGTFDVPFSATAALVRHACSIEEDGSPEQARAALQSALEDIVADEERRESLRKELEPLVAPAQPEHRPKSGEASAARIMSAVGGLLNHLAQAGPVVLCMDGLQWADTPSIEMLRAMVHRDYRVPCFVVMGSRPDARLEEVFAGVPRIDVDELDDQERRQLIRSRFRGAEVPDDVERAIVHRAGGNPFFLIELVDALLERGVVAIEGATGNHPGRVVRRPGAVVTLPSTLEGVVAGRLDELSEAERRALRWLSVAGPGLQADDLSALTGGNIKPALAALEKRGFVRRRAGESYGFRSNVVRQVAYESADATDRAHMHRAVAQRMSGFHHAAEPARIARHLEQAGDEGGAARAYLDAADAALRVYSNADALRFFERSLKLLPPEAPDRFRAHLGREAILRELGREDERAEELKAMWAVAERNASVRMIAQATNRRVRSELDRGQLEGVESMIQEALSATIAADVPDGEIDSLRLLAELEAIRQNPEQALVACDQALVRAGLDRALLPDRALVLVQQGAMLELLGRLSEALEAYAEAVVIFRRVGHKRSESRALHRMGRALAAEGLYEDAVALLRTSIQLDVHTGNRTRVGLKLSELGSLYGVLGDYTSARSFSERALDVFRTTDELGGRCDVLVRLAELELDIATREAPGTSDPEHIVASVYLEEASKLLDRAVAIGEGSAEPSVTLRERLARAWLLRASGDSVGSADVARQALALADSLPWASERLHARVVLALALAARQPDRARELAQEAQSIRHTVGPFWDAERFGLRLGQLYFQLGLDEDARSVWGDTASLIQERADRMRDASLRGRYLSGTHVRAVRQHVGAG